MQKSRQGFAAATKPADKPRLEVVATDEPEPAPRVKPTPQEIANGWTEESLNDYLARDGSIHAQQFVEGG